MTTQQLKLHLVESLSVPEQVVDSLLAALVESIGSFAKDLDEIAIPGFGTFIPVKIDERVEVDKDSGAMSLIPPSVDLEFNPSVVVRKRFIG